MVFLFFGKVDRLNESFEMHSQHSGHHSPVCKGLVVKTATIHPMIPQHAIAAG